jgi:uncharacterized RDD family membrane protein YckC
MSTRPLELRDQLSIDTPELVSIDLPVAGIGSRCVAVLIDYLIQGFTLWIGILLIALIDRQNPGSTPAVRSSTAYKFWRGLRDCHPLPAPLGVFHSL